MRKNLKKARLEAGMTQQQMADKLGVGLRQYQRIETGETIGTVEMWDKLEDLFKIHQRKLRECFTDVSGQKVHQVLRPKNQQ